MSWRMMVAAVVNSAIDNAQEEHDMPGDVRVGVAAHIPDVPAIAKADGAHGQRDDLKRTLIQ